jgi:AcrR family transcriptional regulator
MPANMKRQIAAMFLEMAKKKPVDKITVTDLVEACDISRQTFYYHFQDLLEVIEWLAQQALEKGLEASLGTSDPREAIRQFFAVVSCGHEIIPKLLQSRKRSYVEGLIVSGVRSYLQALAQRQVLDLGQQPEEREITLEFYTYGISGLIVHHSEGKTMDADLLSHHVCRLVFPEQPASAVG